MAEERKRRGCLKVGCLGCLVLLGLTIVGLVVLALIATFVEAPPAAVEHRTFDQKPPGSALVWGEQIEGGAEPRSIDLLPRMQVDEPGRIILDLSMGEFEIVPGPAGEPVRIEADYDTASFELVQEYETYGERGWIYRIEFDSKFGFFRQLGSKDPGDNRIRIVLPRDVPLALEGTLGLGEARVELGGLWLVDVDLDVGVGEHTVSFEEPLLQPLERFRLEGSLGETRIRGLGQASPRRALVGHSIGELRVDLSGAWLQDAEVSVESSLGELWVGGIPAGVNVDLQHAGVAIGESDLRALRRREPAPDGSPTLSLSLDHGIGELRVSGE